MRSTKAPKVSTTASRPSLLISLKLYDTGGFPLDEQVAWDHIVAAFKDHPYLRVEKALIGPDKEGSSL